MFQDNGGVSEGFSESRLKSNLAVSVSDNALSFIPGAILRKVDAHEPLLPLKEKTQPRGGCNIT